ncbi:DUF2325 domain-containing protein [Lactobacillus sp. PV012]|uniref:DUF2325 domain-containing protein n=1 Tax=Lactobacillus sp. PV012 TaxID=2594494 RepID=UPI002240236C|nr:DUF2325 domain-containing protein [Lactobacillus sp. PV012]QNQ82071.1 DUF2325 domain-containing protein [Lactobacillus sp. PV012]
MYDYRNNLKRILNKTAGDDKSLQNSLSAIKAILAMAEGGEVVSTQVVPKKEKSSDHNQEKIQLFNSLLNNIAELIASPGNEKAKKEASGAIHKLTFFGGISKKYGKSLGRLDNVIQKSVETDQVVNQKIFEQALKPKKQVKRDYRTGKRYTIIRTLSGAQLTTDNGDIAFEVNENQIHSLNLKTGDIVEALENKTSLGPEVEILRVVGYKNMRKRDYDQIETFRYGVVQGSSGNLSVSRNVKGQKLKIRGKNIIVPVDSSYYQNGTVHLEDGSIVDLAWYSEDVRLKKDPASAVKIRWIYETEAPKRVGKTPKKINKTNLSPTKIETLDLDLHYQRVGIAIGDNQNEKILEEIVNKYNGIPIPINAFEGKKKAMENQIKNLDIVILVTAFAAHDSTWNIREFASKYKVKFAVSSSKGYQSFERALYRAANGMPAYEGNQQLEYKKKKIKNKAN